MLIRSCRFIKTADVNSEIHGERERERGGGKGRSREFRAVSSRRDRVSNRFSHCRATNGPSSTSTPA